MEPAVNETAQRKLTGLALWLAVLGACLVVAVVGWLAVVPRDADTRSVSTPPPATTQTRPAAGAVVPEGNTGSGAAQPARPAGADSSR